ncbi:zinc finger protein 37-like isoform X2 [Crassostrea angulata]|uniref:zinc finger protein 37-like isoform X2 n=1 Tax=Magallana angulata TaxID=2784310 RepID=UPI0022B0D8F6|nr:zinc finger protein 37-like isoform X2 [Crassostrea angulata]
MLNDCDIMRLEIRKGKFLFKMAVRGKTDSLPKSLKQKEKNKRRKSVEEESPEVEEDSPEAVQESLKDKKSPEVEGKSSEVEESLEVVTKEMEEEQGGRGYQDDNIGSFPPIQVCERHSGNWQSSTLTDDVIDEAGKMQQPGRIYDEEGNIYKDGGDFNLIERALIHEHYLKEIKSDTIETDSKTCGEDEFKDADFVTYNEYETSTADVVMETKPYEYVDVYGNSEEEMDDEEPCEYNYILDSDEFQCDSSLDVSESTNHIFKYTEPEDANTSETYKQITSKISPEDEFKYSSIKKNDCVDECNFGADENKLCDDKICVGRMESTNKVTDNIGIESDETNRVGSSIMEDDEGEATETEFEPLEGDEWEGMDTFDVDSCHQEKNCGEYKNSILGGSSDEEDSSSELEDLIGQYVTYMPKEISRSVNSKRRAARVPPTSATYRRCSSELRRYFCEQCGLSYQSLTDYQTHKKTHGENKCEKFTIPKMKEIREGIAGKSKEKRAKTYKNSDHEKHRKKLKTDFDLEKNKSKTNIHDDIKFKTRDKVQLKLHEKKSSSQDKRQVTSNGQKKTRSHDNVHAKPTTEKTAVLRYEKKSKTSQDIETRLGVKLKKCNVCDKKFEPRILERHLRSHTGERPYLCDQCPFRCSQIGNLNKHRAIVHWKMSDKTRERVLQHKCDKCQKQFYDSAHLKRHELTHFDKTVKHYACPVCKKKFRFDSGLQRHMQLHQEGLKIRCGICDRRFYDSSGLKNHMNQHTYDLPYKCERCRISFSSRHGINRHNSMHRKETRHAS